MGLSAPCFLSWWPLSVCLVGFSCRASPCCTLFDCQGISAALVTPSGMSVLWDLGNCCEFHDDRWQMHKGHLLGFVKRDLSSQNCFFFFPVSLFWGMSAIASRAVMWPMENCEAWEAESPCVPHIPTRGHMCPSQASQTGLSRPQGLGHVLCWKSRLFRASLGFHSGRTFVWFLKMDGRARMMEKESKRSLLGSASEQAFVTAAFPALAET